MAARAQRPTPAVGLLVTGAAEPNASFVEAFRKGLGEAGFVEGSNVAIEIRYGGNDIAHLSELAANLVQRRVAVIATLGGPAPVRAVKAANATTPIVFETGSDPIRAGLVASFNRPGGNATGVAVMNADLESKRLGLLHELLPRARRFAALINPSTISDTQLIESRIGDLRAGAAAIGAEIEILIAKNSSEINSAFGGLLEKRVDAILVTTSPLFSDRDVQLATLAARNSLPAMYFERHFVRIGGLMSYAASYSDQVRQVGIYVGRVLKGEKPSDLPVAQPTKFELAINLNTAKALGLTIPETLLATADEVIQ
jgi:putative ABC transport system substrate-binding protein